MDTIRDPAMLVGQCWIPLPLIDHEEDFNSEQYRAAEMASFNGRATARGVARRFAVLACGGELDGVRLLSQAILDDALTEQWQQTDPLGLPCRRRLHAAQRCAGAVQRQSTPLRPYWSWRGPCLW
jgi:hypothetical protein